MQRKQSTIFARILFPMILVAAIQSAVLIGIILAGGVSEELDENAYESLCQQTGSRASEFQKKMTGWGNLGDFADYVEATYSEKGNMESVESKKDFLLEISPFLVSVLRQNKVNGAYIILTDKEEQIPSQGSEITRYGVCIRDLDAEGGHKNDGDLLIDRAPSSVANKIGFPLDTWWESTYKLNEKSDYFYSPLMAIKDEPGLDSDDYRYWSNPYKLSGDDPQVISCSIPLFAPNGQAFAVLGVEIKQNYIESFLPSEEVLEEGKGIYVFAKRNGDEFLPIVHKGFMYSRFMSESESIKFANNPIYADCYKLVDRQDKGQVASLHPLALYNKDAAFADQDFALLAIVQQDELLSFSQNVRSSVLLASVISLLLSILGAFVIGKFFTVPIKSLVEKVRSSTECGQKLGRVNIYEIDELIRSIEELNIGISESEKKTADIIRMSGLMVGTFEVDLRAGQVFVGEEFFRVMEGSGLSESCAENPRSFDLAMRGLGSHLVTSGYDGADWVFCFGERWIRLKFSSSATRITGIVMDITEEMNERRQIEYERDHDSLTGLLNRRAFQQKLAAIFSAPEGVGIGAMLMMDVDNLKYINDSFGHDCGDNYLRLVSSVLKEFEGEKSIAARISGDEFLMFFYGKTNTTILWDKIEEIRKRMGESFITLPQNAVLHSKVSGGIAWCPENSKEPNSLIKFADFAMLQMKRNQKGSFGNFKIEEYRENRLMAESVDEVYRLLDNETVDFFFQPIVHMPSGSIHAYEALMRPMSETIKSPAEALSLAKAIGCLYRMEELTWFKSLEKVQANLPLFGSARLFINSIPNQNLGNKDFETLKEKYSHLMGRVVVEITEEEKAGDESRQHFKLLKQAGIEIAIDDYGSGYNGQVMLLDLNPGYVKIDMSIVRGITKDANRRDVISALVGYGRERNIKIIAEGVETSEELKILVELGVEYVQGYALQRPMPLPCKLSTEAQQLLNSVQNL